MATIQWFYSPESAMPETRVLTAAKSDAELVLEHLDQMAAEIAERLGKRGRMSNYAGADWLCETLKSAKPEMTVSDFGRTVADLLGDLFAGLYHIQNSVIRADWSNKRWIDINLKGRVFCTYDYSNLTKLVILCHDRCIRCQIQAVAPNVLQLTFSPRQREGDMYHRHPTMEQAISEIRPYIQREESEG